MQVLVRTPLIKIEGDIPPDLLYFVKKQYKHVTVEYKCSKCFGYGTRNKNHFVCYSKETR